MNVFELTVCSGAIINCRTTEKRRGEWIKINEHGDGKLAVVAENEETAIFKGKSRVKGNTPLDGYKTVASHFA